MDFSTWYQNNRYEFVSGGTWLQGGEVGVLPLSEWDKRDFKVLFSRLSTYADTGYSFTHSLLYQIAKGVEGVFPDLGYLPPRADLELFERDGVPWCLGTQSKRGPSAFDLIGFSNSIVQELLNLPHFLKRSGIPLSKTKRLADPSLPLVILGGANALYSSSIWLEDPMVDGIFVGESDAEIRKILMICRDGKREGLVKEQVLARLVRGVDGFFEPENNDKKGRRSFAPDLDAAEALERGVVPFLEEAMGRAHLQISEGCPCFCSFCAESWERKPYRERSVKRLKEIALQVKAQMGLESIDIYSFNFNLHSELYEILWELLPHFRQIGLKSERFDLLAHDPESLKIQQLLGKTSLTCGLEGISPRLRRYLSKNLSDADLEASLLAIFKNKARELKVFLIATGLEQEVDFSALQELLKRMQQMRTRSGAQTRVIFSMTPLVRFPWTPLEFDDAPSLHGLASIIHQTSRQVRGAGFEFREASELAEYWVSQVLLRADSPRISRALHCALETTGFIYYREVSERFRSEFEACLCRDGLDPAQILKGFSFEQSEQKPWVRFETGVTREFLWKRSQMGRLFEEEEYCLGRKWVKAKCSHCGGCPTRVHVRDIVLAKQERKYSLQQFETRLREFQKNEKILTFEVEVGEKGRGLARSFLAVALSRALMLEEGRLTEFYRGYAGAFWADEDRPVWVEGWDLVSLYWGEPGLAIIEERMKDVEWLGRVNARLEDVLRLIGLEAPKGESPCNLRIVSSESPDLETYLKSRGLKHTLRKLPEGGHLFELIPASKKKRIMLDIKRGRNAEGSWETHLSVAEKFSFPAFLEECFPIRKIKNYGKLRIIASN
ncbi:radical SAM protein [Bdellovibrionota bacterium FG-2]